MRSARARRGPEPLHSSPTREPLFVHCVGSEVIAMAFDCESGVLKDLRELQSEVAIGEIDDAHAARSKSTASSTAPMLNS